MNDCRRIIATVRRLCFNLDATKDYINISDRQDLTPVPAKPGVYWIETTMPAEDLKSAAIELLGKEKKYPADKPSLVKQNGNDFYLCYMGTENSISARLGQHLFNTNKGKERLGCDISKKPFSDYSWRIWYKEIEDTTVRYAVENWWRHNKEWPPFCVRGS